MEKVAAKKSQEHLSDCWFLKFEAIRIFIIWASHASHEDQRNNKHLNKEYHCTFKEVILKEGLKCKFVSNIENHTSKSKAINTIIEIELLVSMCFFAFAFGAFFYGFIICTNKK